MVNKRIGFRLDGSEELGLGHLMRCLALADSLDGWDTFFWVNDNPCVMKIFQDRRNCYTVPELNIQSEIDFVVAEIKNKQIDAIVVDFLDYFEGYLEGLKRSGVKIISFFEQKHSCPYSDLVINCNSFKGFDNYKCNTSDANCLGPPYVIIRETIRKLKEFLFRWEEATLGE
jgi:UDP-2,4-diacetamido-2,4,6-trideoxy-beta-L-altropyranose hydrolase